MKKTNRNTEIDWVIAAPKEEMNNPDSVIDYKTIGFEKYGYGEIVVLGKVSNAVKIVGLINTFGCMLIEGEKFDQGVIHCINDVNGNKEYSFSVAYVELDNNEKWIQLMPDFEADTYKNF